MSVEICVLLLNHFPLKKIEKAEIFSNRSFSPPPELIHLHLQMLLLIVCVSEKDKCVTVNKGRGRNGNCWNGPGGQ